MAGGDEDVVISRDASAATVVAETAPGPEHEIILHEEPPVYTLSVEYGDLDALFKDPTAIDGRQERMQACGFYYGAVDGDEGPITRRCSRHLREELDHRTGRTLSDSEYQTEFQNLLKCIIRKADGTLVPETDFTASARLVFPGSFTFREDNQLGAPLSRHRYNAEQRMWDGNQGLGKIPIVAEVRNGAGDPACVLALQGLPPSLLF